MVLVRETDILVEWLNTLRDKVAKVKITARLVRLALGNPGDVRPIGDGLSELRIHHGPGHRVYFAQRGATLIILLCGGDTATQARDIEAAKAMARELG